MTDTSQSPELPQPAQRPLTRVVGPIPTRAAEAVVDPRKRVRLASVVATQGVGSDSSQSRSFTGVGAEGCDGASAERYLHVMFSVLVNPSLGCMYVCMYVPSFEILVFT